MKTKRIVSVTGHRPDKLGGYNAKTHKRLFNIAMLWLTKNRPDKILCGMAQGWDQAVCEAALVLNIPVSAFIPFRGQEKKWTPKAQSFYNALLGDCNEVIIYSSTYDIAAYQGRNKLMVDRSDLLLAFWNGDEEGGTWNTVKYAQKVKREIINLYKK